MDKIRSDSYAIKRAAEARAALLRDWLRNQSAACLWRQEVERVGMIEAWTANARIFLIQHYARGDGFEIYIPASASNRTDETFAAVSRYLQGGTELKELRREVEGLRAFKRSVDEALNSGDGSYRP